MTIATALTLDKIKASATIAISTRAAELKAAGEDVINLAAGEPDFDTPDDVKAAAITAINQGLTKYTAVDGTPELKRAIIDKFSRENQLDFTAKQIIVSSGAKQCIFNLMIALLNPGDEAIIPAPYWVSYPDMVKLAGGLPVFVATKPEQKYKIGAAQLEAAITEKTRLLILNSPGNPSGMAYTASELADLGSVLQEHPGICIVSDDIYEHIYWADAPYQCLLNACPHLGDRTITVNGVSKAYAMTGWRIGYAAGPEHLIAGMRKVQSQSTSNPCSISQVAAIQALNGDQSQLRHMVSEFKCRHDYFIAALNRIKGFSCTPADGAFYAFPDVSQAINAVDGVVDDLQLTNYILDRTGVATVPGSAFGAKNHIRLSYASSMDVLQEAASRIQRLMS